jgi:hypothetical protein
MTSHPFNGRLSAKRAGLGAVFTAFAAISIYSMSATTGHAQAQAAVETEVATLAPGKTIATCTPTVLAEAVADLIEASSSFTPGDLAAAALEPYPSGATKARSDAASKSGPDVLESAIGALISNSGLSTSGTNFATNAAAIVNEMATDTFTDGATQKAVFSESGQETLATDGLATISAAYQAGTSGLTQAQLLAGDTAIGNALATDASLIALTKSGLTTILADAIKGIPGFKDNGVNAAPVAAAAFVSGILENGVPDSGQGGTADTFAVAILKNVATNASVAELVANAVAVGTNSTSDSALEGLAAALYPKYSKDVAKITQGLVAVVPQNSSGEAGRVTLIEGLTTASPKDVTPIAQGAVYVDPYYAGAFTLGAADAILTSGGTKGVKDLGSDAGKMATGIGNVLGQDGTYLTDVASVYSELTGSADLAAASAGTFAGDLITGAETSKVPSTQFTGLAAGLGGGTLAVKTGIVGTTVTDLETIEDLFAEGIYTADSSTFNTEKGAETVGTDIGTLAKDIAKLTAGETFTDSTGISGGVPTGSSTEPVAVFLAGTLADYVVSLGLSTDVYGTTNAQAIILADIEKDVEAEAKTAKADVGDVFTAANTQFYYGTIDYKYYTGPVALPETAITNL